MPGLSVSVSSLFFYPYLFRFLFLFLCSFLFWVSFPKFIAPFNSAKMQLRIRWLFPFPCRLFVCFSTSMVTLGLPCSFSSYLPSPLFVPCFSGFVTLSILLFHYFFALQMSLYHYLPFFIFFNVLLPLLIPLLVPVQFRFLFSSFFMTYHSVSFGSSQHWVGSVIVSTCKAYYTFKFIPFSVAFSNFYYAFLSSSIFPLALMVLLASQVQIVFVPLWERTLIRSQRRVSWSTHVTKGSISYLSSPCFSTSLGGIGGPARAIHGILAVMYWISIIRAPPRKWSWVQFPRVTRSRAPTLEAHFPWGRCSCSPA